VESDYTILEDHFEDIYFALHQRGVPEERVPHPELILSMIMDKFLNQEKLTEWIDDYAEIHYDPLLAETVEQLEDARKTFTPPKLKRQRPGYLKVLQEEDPEDEDDDLEGA